MECSLFLRSVAGRRTCCDMIPPEPSSSNQLQRLSSSSRAEDQENDSCCTRPAALQPLEQPAHCSCCCQREANIFVDHLRRLLPTRAGITARHQHRRAVSRRGIVSMHNRRHSAVQRLGILPVDREPALPRQVCCDVIKNKFHITLNDCLRSSTLADRMVAPARTYEVF